MIRAKLIAAQLHIAVSCAALLCAACAGPGQQAAQPQPPADAELLGALPGLPAGLAGEARAASSSPIYYPSTPPADWLSASPSCFEDGGDGVIPASGGHAAYALYELPIAGCQLQELDLEFTVVGGQAWLALPDYETGRWEFDGPLTVAPEPYNWEDPKRYSPGGRSYFGLIAWDGAQVRLSSIKRRIESGDALLHTVADVGTETWTSLVNVGGSAGLAYFSQLDDALHYAHPTADPPASSQDWRVTQVDSGDNAGKVNDLAVVNGKPVLAYSVPGVGRIRFAWSDVAQPAQNSDWHSVDVAVGDFASPSIAVVTGQPMLAFHEADGADADQDSTFGYLRIATHSGTDLSTGWTHYRAATAALDDCAPSINAYNGIPSCCYLEGIQLHYGRAINSSPASDFEWGFHFFGPPAATGGRLRLLFFDGVPAVGFRTVGGLATYAWALQPLPAGFADWNSESFVGTTANSPSAFDLANINGLPTLLCQHILIAPYSNVYLFRLFNYDYDTSMGDYAVTVGVDGGDDYGPAYSLIGLDGQPAFCYYVPDGQGGGAVRYGRIAYEMGN